jgi:hypothetical protein
MDPPTPRGQMGFPWRKLRRQRRQARPRMRRRRATRREEGEAPYVDKYSVGECAVPRQPESNRNTVFTRGAR